MSDTEMEYPRSYGVLLKPGVRVFCDDRDHLAYDMLGTIVSVEKRGAYSTFQVQFDGPNGRDGPTLHVDYKQIQPDDKNTEEAVAWRAARQLRVFLCHGSEDKKQVRDLYARLKSSGLRPWLDEEDITPGADWDAAIRKAVRECHVVLVCLSKTSVEKTGYVQKEIKFALDRADEKPEDSLYIIPARLEECDVPRRLSRWQRVDLHISSGYERLVEALGAEAVKLKLGA